MSGTGQMKDASRPLRVGLVCTAAPDAPGSMRLYADLAEEAIHAVRPDWTLVRLNLAPRSRIMARCPAPLRTAVRYASVAAGARRLRQSDVDAFHILDGSHAFVARWLATRPSTATVHDVIPWLQLRGQFGGRRPWGAGRRMVEASLRGLSGLSGLVAVSRRTREDVASATGLAAEGIGVAPNALAAPYRAALARQEASPRVGSPFVLHVGNDAFYKNRAGVLRIFAAMRAPATLELVCVGPAPDPGLRRLGEVLGIAGRVRWMGNRRADELVALYRRAALLLFPSLYEGFGWPPLEAMACGCPVVCSNAGALPEVVGNAALTAPPEEESALARHGERVLAAPAVATDLREAGWRQAAGFTVEAMGRALAGCCEAAMGH